jgi:hypothetical protein
MSKESESRFSDKTKRDLVKENYTEKTIYAYVSLRQYKKIHDYVSQVKKERDDYNFGISDAIREFIDRL